MHVAHKSKYDQSLAAMLKPPKGEKNHAHFVGSIVTLNFDLHNKTRNVSSPQKWAFEYRILKTHPKLLVELHARKRSPTAK